jgi:hypothetical protein
MDGKPDALFMPGKLKRGARLVDRVASIADIAEPTLGLDRSNGERAYIRVQPGDRLFITANPLDTIFFPLGHDRSGQPRYRWERGDDGIERGYLVEGA